MNRLYFGDNLDILREHVAAESVDLVYLDPPFNSKADYNVLFKTTSGEASAAQATAFKDTWEWDEKAAEAYHELMMSGAVPDRLKKLMEALKVFLTGDTGKRGNSMMAYLTMMALRLVELHRVLKSTGSLYLHCDPTASHYIKLILDGVFGFQGFMNEITWQRTGAHNDARRFGNVADVIFFYTKSSTYTWKTLFTPYEQAYIDERYRYVDEKSGRRFWANTMTAAGHGPARQFRGKMLTPPEGTHWRYSQENIDLMEREGRIYYSSSGMPYVKSFLDEQQGKAIQSIWTDIRMSKSGAERLGYPTQKPEALLERIIQASSNEGDLVLDPFCGCGTTIAVAEKLNRKWIGIDVTYLAVDLMERRLLDQFTPLSAGELANIPVQKRRHALKTYWSTGKDELMIGIKTGLKPYEVVGTPTSVEDARFLFQNDPFQFEWWCVAMLGAQGRERKGADKGIDGVIHFTDKPGQYKKALVSVKGGKVQREMIATLKGDMAREGAVSGILVVLEEPTGPMRREAADAGRWTSEFQEQRSFPVIQILAVAEILRGDAPDVPRWGMDTFKKAAKAKRQDEQHPELFA